MCTGCVQSVRITCTPVLHITSLHYKSVQLHLYTYTDHLYSYAVHLYTYTGTYVHLYTVQLYRKTHQYTNTRDICTSVTCTDLRAAGEVRDPDVSGVDEGDEVGGVKAH